MKTSAYALVIAALLGAPIVIVSASVQAASDEQTRSGPEAFVDRLGGDVLEFLADKPSETATQDRFSSLLRERFDMAVIGKFVLGRYWREATQEQRTEYLGLFEKMIVKIYADRFRQYSGERFEVQGSQAVAGSSGDFLVQSRIVPPGRQAVAVSWRVRQNGDSYKIIDAVVEGVSMASTQRDEFTSVIQRGGGIDALLDELRKRNGG